jgi:Rrf2 family nitric oxide-sensitive transcriptional repressor
MRLTTFTDYTLRTLMYLAVRDEPARIADISAAYGISDAHLTKVVQLLALSGDVHTTRGRNGGLRLGRTPVEINLGTVIRRTEPDLQLMECFGAGCACVIQPACVLQNTLSEALAAFLAVLDRTTLADLVAPRSTLAKLLAG